MDDLTRLLEGGPVAAAGGEEGVDDRVLDIAVPEPVLDEAQVGAGLDARDKVRDERRVVLQVGVEGQRDRPADPREAGGQRGRLAEVLTKVHDAHIRVARRQLVELLAAAVTAAVVDEQDLVAAPHPPDRGGDLRVELVDRLDLVEHRNHEGDVGRLGARQHGGACLTKSRALGEA